MGKELGRGRLAVFLLAQVFASIAVAVLAASAAGVQLRPIGDAVVFGFWFGVAFSQISLLAVWNAFGTQRFFVRLFVSLAGGFAVWLVTVQLVSRNFETGVPGLAMMVQWILVQLPLWVVRASGSYRFQGPEIEAGVSEGDAKKRASRAGDRQFGIAHLIGWMTAVGLLLGISRLVLASNRSHPDLYGFPIFMCFNCLLTWPAIVAGTSRMHPLASILFLPVIVAILSRGEYFVFGFVPGANVDEWLFWPVNTVQLVWVAGSLSVLSALGFRIVKTEVPDAVATINKKPSSPLALAAEPKTAERPI